MRSEFSETVSVAAGIGGSLVPLDGVISSAYFCNSDGSDGAIASAYSDRITDIPAKSLATDEAGSVSYYLDNGDYNIHFHDPSSRIADYVRAFSSITSGISVDYASLNATVSTLESRALHSIGVDIPTSESTTSTSYSTLPTPDSSGFFVIGSSSPTIVAILYRAQWSESVVGAARAAINVSGSLSRVAGYNANNFQAAYRGSTTPNVFGPLTSCPMGLVSSSMASYTGDAANGQPAALVPTSVPLPYMLGASQFSETLFANNTQPLGGIFWTYIDTPGTYEIFIQYMASSGSVTVKNRSLRVITMPLR